MDHDFQKIKEVCFEFFDFFEKKPTRNTIEKHLFFLFKVYYFFKINLIQQAFRGIKFTPPPTGSNGSQRVSTGSNGFQRVPTGSNGSQLVPTDPNWFQWVPTGHRNTQVCFLFLDFFDKNDKNTVENYLFFFYQVYYFFIINPCCLKFFSS
jgi:hypothetical protein